MKKMKQKVLYLLLLPITLTLPSLKIGRTQSVAVKGVLMCNNKPAANVQVKLSVDNRGQNEDDDLIDSETTDSEGRFLLKGHKTEITTINVKLNVYHTCNDEDNPCMRKLSVPIPNSFISEGQKPQKTFDVGTINLAGKFSGELQRCFELNKK